MKYPTISSLAFLLLLLIAISGLRAQVNSAIDTIYVKSTRIPLSTVETGRNITVLEAEAIRQMPYTSLDDLLQYIPGVEVQSRNAFGAQGDITMRGSTFTQVLVLIDGMKMNDPLTGHFNSYIPVTPAEIERIEVLRGAASAMYGADAVGGVIHIITKNFAGDNSPQSTFSGQVNYGENRLVNAQQGFSVNRQKYFLGGGFSMNQSDGQLIPGQEVEGNNLEPYNNFFNLKTFGLSFGYRLSDTWQVSARTAYDDRNFSARYFYTTSPFDKSVETTRTWWNQLTVSKISERSNTDFRMAYRNGTDEFVFSPDFPSTNLHTTHFWNFNADHLHLISEHASVQIGLQVDRRSIESTDRGNHSDNHMGAYAMGVLRPNDQWSINGSLRLDYDDNFGFEVSPQLNLSYLLTNLTLRASVGRSIRAADYTERYVSFNLQDLTPGRSLGNPNLEAERAWSEEIGADYRLTPDWTIKATGFLRQSANLIDYVSTNEARIPGVGNLQEGADYFFASNITDVQTAGFEIESWLQKSLSTEVKLQWSIGYTFLNTTNEEDVISVYITSHARHLFTTNFSLETNRFQLALNGLHKSRDARSAAAINAQLQPDYQIWNARLGYRITPEFGLNLQIHNVFDEEYQDILGAQMPGRWVMTGIRFRL